jgi:hypothetical protein
MRRMHLFEFEDQSWCPNFVREITTDFLSAYYVLKKVYDPAFEKINEILEKTKVDKIIDCCSGSGGPVRGLREFLDSIGKTSTTITLTDKYPNQKLFEKIEATYPKKIIAYKNSLDAAQLPSSLKGMRTLFSSFHHFRPKQALEILKNAANNEAPIGIFECTERHPREFIRVLLSPIIILFVVPFTTKLSWKKFIFTYLLPIIPFVHMWEYFVSNLRTYSVKELKALTQQINALNYQWEVGQLWSTKAKCSITYLIGYKDLVEKN